MLCKGSTIQQLNTYSAFFLLNRNHHFSTDLLKKICEIISLILFESDFLDDLSNLIKLWHEETGLAHENRGCEISQLLACPFRLTVLLDYRLTCSLLKNPLVSICLHITFYYDGNQRIYVPLNAPIFKPTTFWLIPRGASCPRT